MADYVDIDFSMEKNQYNDIDLKEDVQAVKQSMIDILLTKIGEREMMPNYGSKIFSILFEKMNEFTSIQLREEILVALDNWEPRIKVNSIEVDINREQSYYDVTINFELIRLAQLEQLNLVLNRVS
jgi:phage baseplate assembly protein W